MRVKEGSMVKEKLKQHIKMQKEKVERLNKFEKNMHFIDDRKEVEIYEFIHREEVKLARLEKLYEEQYGQDKEKSL